MTAKFDFAFDLGIGPPARLGASLTADGTSFALFSDHATRVELILFDASGKAEVFRQDLPQAEGGIWYGYLPQVRAGQRYGYRVHGPWAPQEGHRFNPAKLLLDPYACQTAGDLIWDAALFGHDLEADDLTISLRDSGPYMPHAVVCDWNLPALRHAPPRHDWNDVVIYEAHLKGLTQTHPALSDTMRGSFAALGHPKVVDYLKSLGISTLELLPVQGFFTDQSLTDKGLTNYWGYNTLSFFAPHRPYLSTGQLAEFRDAIDRLHDAGIEVILDVVYNHTAEGSELGPTLSFRGIDNASYYMLAEDRRHCFDTTGTGNALNMAHPMVLRMVMDSLRYWVQQMGVDGFRFDLASTLGRGPQGFDQRGAFLAAICQDPVLAKVKLIAEPWDIADGGYQLGGFPWPFREWNDKCRDDLRRFWKGDEGMLPRLSQRLLGSPVQFDHDRRPATSSINFLTAHDGFTLYDLCAYAHPLNDANGEGGQDGHDNNHSDNFGEDGPSLDPDREAARLRRIRAMMASLLLSQGVPMWQAGDERGRSQQGNNNAYAQDNAISWMDWDKAPFDLSEEVSALIALRKDLALASADFLRDDDSHGALWLHPSGGQMTPEHWEDAQARAVGLQILRRDHPALLMLLNASDEVEFTLPSGDWLALWDSTAPAEDRIFSQNLTLGGQSLLLLQAG